jgi:hypothetical protein
MIFGANGQLKVVSDHIESCARNGKLSGLLASLNAHGPINFWEVKAMSTLRAEARSQWIS